jgi:hypothetical protein
MISHVRREVKRRDVATSMTFEAIWSLTARKGQTSQPRDLERACAANHALGRRRCEPGAHQPDYHVDRKAVRDHDCLGAAVAA